MRFLDLLKDPQKSNLTVMIRSLLEPNTCRDRVFALIDANLQMGQRIKGGVEHKFGMSSEHDADLLQFDRIAEPFRLREGFVSIR